MTSISASAEETTSAPLEVRTRAEPRWALGDAVAARIVLGPLTPAPRGAAPPTTALDGDMMALWPRYALDG